MRAYSLGFVLVGLILMGGNCSRARVESMNEMNAGVELAQMKRFSEAAQSLEKAAAIDPTNHQAYFNLAIVQIELRSFSAASRSSASRVCCSVMPWDGSGGTPVSSRSSPGTWVTIDCDGEKPSLRFHSVGSTTTPALFSGIDSMARLIRRPVSVDSSATVKTLLGQGNIQFSLSRISQRSAFGVSMLIGGGN